jgi:hypothetical protein
MLSDEKTCNEVARHYHHEGAARLEAQAIAHVLLLDRKKR